MRVCDESWYEGGDLMDLRVNDGRDWMEEVEVEWQTVIYIWILF